MLLQGRVNLIFVCVFSQMVNLDNLGNNNNIASFQITIGNFELHLLRVSEAKEAPIISHI